MNMQTQGLRMMMDTMTKGFSQALTEKSESLQKTWAEDKKALETKLSQAEKDKGELQRLLVDMREEWKTSNQQWTTSWQQQQENVKEILDGWDEVQRDTRKQVEMLCLTVEEWDTRSGDVSAANTDSTPSRGGEPDP